MSQNCQGQKAIWFGALLCAVGLASTAGLYVAGMMLMMYTGGRPWIALPLLGVAAIVCGLSIAYRGYKIKE